jgi:complex III assembly factor LYRM7
MQAWNKDTMGFYRRLLKSMMITFKGDYEMFHRVRLEAKQKIRENKELKDELQIQ